MSYVTFFQVPTRFAGDLSVVSVAAFTTPHGSTRCIAQLTRSRFVLRQAGNARNDRVIPALLRFRSGAFLLELHVRIVYGVDEDQLPGYLWLFCYGTKQGIFPGNLEGKLYSHTE